MDGWGVLAEAAELARRGEPFALATVVWRQGPSSSQQGSRAIITAAGELRGWIGGACAEPSVIREAQHVIATGEAKLLLLGSPEQFGSTIQIASTGHVGDNGQIGGEVPDGMLVVPISCSSEGALEVYIEPVVPVPHLVVVGRSPMAHTLAELAETLGWRADLIDGPEFSSADAGEHSMVVVASQGHNDEVLLERAIGARPAYVGLVGSRKRGAAVLGYLADRGVPQDQLKRVRVPAGLDLGTTTHQEIAVAILAELVQLRAAGMLSGAGSDAVPAPKARRKRPAPSPQATDEIDPVCGMTVTVGPDSIQFAHGGATYYFCGAGCRQSFERDPDAYVQKLLTTRTRHHADQE
jgi:xanthine dehydrogenase accessory factor